MKVTLHPLATTDDNQHPATGYPDAPLPLDLALATRLQRYFRILSARGDLLARTFFERLFATHPHFRQLFPKDLTVQQKKLMDTLEWVVMNLADRPAVLSAVSDLGRRHVSYGARADDYPIVVETLIAAMRATGRDAFTLEAEADWRTALHLIAHRMANAGPTTHSPSPSKPADPEVTPTPTAHGSHSAL